MYQLKLLNAQAFFVQYVNVVDLTFKWMYQIKATPGITGLIGIKAQIYRMIWHLDVGLPKPKSVVSLLVWVLIR